MYGNVCKVLLIRIFHDLCRAHNREYGVLLHSCYARIFDIVDVRVLFGRLFEPILNHSPYRKNWAYYRALFAFCAQSNIAHLLDSGILEIDKAFLSYRPFFNSASPYVQHFSKSHAFIVNIIMTILAISLRRILSVASNIVIFFIKCHYFICTRRTCRQPAALFPFEKL